MRKRDVLDYLDELEGKLQAAGDDDNAAIVTMFIQDFDGMIIEEE